MTDGLEQYHKLAQESEGITNANFFAHARRYFANTIKANSASERALQNFTAEEGTE